MRHLAPPPPPPPMYHYVYLPSVLQFFSSFFLGGGGGGGGGLKRSTQPCPPPPSTHTDYSVKPCHHYPSPNLGHSRHHHHHPPTSPELHNETMPPTCKGPHMHQGFFLNYSKTITTPPPLHPLPTLISFPKLLLEY